MHQHVPFPQRRSAIGQGLDVLFFIAIHMYIRTDGNGLPLMSAGLRNVQWSALNSIDREIQILQYRALNFEAFECVPCCPLIEKSTTIV